MILDGVDIKVLNFSTQQSDTGFRRFIGAL
jgi:hypothetical protein